MIVLPGSTESEADLSEPSIPADSKPLSTEIGRASWYGPPYHNHVGSNGEVYNMHAMTAAHRTLPLGAVVRVTNVKTGHTALVRITDRGPFIPGGFWIYRWRRHANSMFTCRELRK